MQKNSLLPGIIYGPVFSRRLGRSLGINLLPSDRKICSFDCVYCECRNTEELTLTPDRKDLPTIEAILFVVEHALRKPRTIDHLTFSGNGEPTLHPDFPEIVQGIREIRDRLRPQTKLVLFTNASTAGSTKIAEALRWIDVPIMKLDAGNQTTFSVINQPSESITLQDIVDGMRPISPLMIQSMLINGDPSNARGEAYESWANLLVDLKPEQVQIYTVDRPTACEAVGELEPKMILKIENDLRERFKLNVKAY